MVGESTAAPLMRNFTSRRAGSLRLIAYMWFGREPPGCTRSRGAVSPPICSVSLLGAGSARPSAIDIGADLTIQRLAGTKLYRVDVVEVGLTVHHRDDSAAVEEYKR